LQKCIDEGIKAQAQNRRQRVQGSYDYESMLILLRFIEFNWYCLERKRKRRLPEGEQEVTSPNSPSDETPPINGENGDSQDGNLAILNEDESSTFDSDASGIHIVLIILISNRFINLRLLIRTFKHNH
jgi:hypothetical protein